MNEHTESNPAARLAIVYHSGYGHTEVVAREIALGAQGVPGVSAAVVPVADLPPDAAPDSGAWGTLLEADAIVFGSPTYMGSVSAEMKAFMDATGKVWGKQLWKDKLAAGFTNAGGLSGDKLHALTTIALFAAQHSMVWVSQGVFYNDEGINRMSAWLGLMTQSDDASPEVTPPEEDRATARLFGERVAHAALRWARGAATT